MKKCFVLGLWLLNIVACAQKNDCNRNVWIERFTKLLPKEVCIRMGNYHITEVYKKTDINNDGLIDFMFDWNKNPLNDGDTIYVSIYIQKPDSTFAYFRTFKNLYPIYFERYDLDYIPKDSALVKMQRRYENFYPLRKLEFENDKIRLRIRYDAEADLIVTYKFDSEKKNWFYEKAEEYFFSSEGSLPKDYSKVFGPTIDDFTYFYWEKDE